MNHALRVQTTAVSVAGGETDMSRGGHRPGTEGHQGGMPRGPSHRQKWENKDLASPQGDLSCPSILLVIWLEPLAIRITGRVVWTLPWPFLPWRAASHVVDSLQITFAV